MKKKEISIASAILIIGILFLIFGTPSYQSIRIKSADFIGFKDKLKEMVSRNNEVNIKELTDFDWDEGYVFTPYYPPQEIYNRVGTEWTTTKTYIGYLLFHNTENQTVNDDEYVIVFKKDSKVVLAANYSLNELLVIFKLDDYKFLRNNSKFTVTAAKQYEEGKIKELTVK